MIANGCHLKLSLYVGLTPCKPHSPQAIYSLGTFHVLSAEPPPRIFEQGVRIFSLKKPKKFGLIRQKFSEGADEK